MNAVRLRSSSRALLQVRRVSALRSQTRLASTESSHSSSSSTHNPTQPATEGFGLSFYLLVIALPASVLVYNFSRDADASSNPISAFITAYTTSQEFWRERNALHTRMVEQASHDRNLFANTPSPVFTKLRFPEAVNAGSPNNHHAGHARANMQELIEYYRNKAFTEEEEKLKKQSEGKLPGQANYERSPEKPE